MPGGPESQFLSKLQMVIQVKRGLTMSYYSPDDTAQLLAQLLLAADMNQRTTYAALTDFHTWKLFQVRLTATFLQGRKPSLVTDQRGGIARQASMLPATGVSNQAGRWCSFGHLSRPHTIQGSICQGFGQAFSLTFRCLR